ncbi:hypothetical protein U9M48_036334 [Paspalum notatum var. saurae]|uniref:Uncharacterized protein n=1 Tax=Paspalum notatum var. saurae TaxID=547442 RepID=A0AAQ3X9Y7_PASNO
MADASPQMTPMSTSAALDADEDGKEVDQKVYRGMIGSLLYLTATRPDIQFAVVSWSSRKQSSLATSTCEAEYVAAASCCSQILWMLATLRDYGLTYGRIPILCDSSSAISVAKNPVLHSRTKHIDVVGEGVDKALIKEEIEGLKCTESGLSSWL